MDKIDYSEIIFSAPFGYSYNRFIFDENGNPADYEIIEINDMFESLSGIKREKILGMRLTEAVSGAGRGALYWIEIFGRVVKRGVPEIFEHYNERLNRWYRIHVTPYNDNFFSTMFFDISELKNAERNLRERSVSLEKRVREMDLLTRLSVLMQRNDLSFDLVIAESVVMIRNVFLTPDNISVSVNFRDEVYRTENFHESRTGISSHIYIRGERCGRIDIFYTGDAADEAEHFSSGDRETIDLLARYIGQFAEKVESDIALKDSYRQMKQYLDLAPDGIFIVDGMGNYVEVNPAACELLGYTKDEILKLSIADITQPDMIDYGLAGFRGLKESGRNSMEITLVRKDGSCVYVVLDSVALPDGRFMAFCKDISMRRKFQNDLVRTLMLNEALIDTIPTPIYYKDIAGKYRGVNRAFADFFGRGKDEIVGRSVLDILPPEYAELFIRMDRELVENQGVQVFEAPLPDATGRVHDVMLHKGAYYDEDGNKGGVIGVIVDISERKKSEKELELYFKAIQSVDQPLLITDMNGDILRVNNAFMKMYGYKSEELIGQNPKVLNPGKEVYINFGYSEEDYESLFSSLWEAISNPGIGTWEDVVINRKKDGSILWVRLLVNAVYDEQSRPVNYIALPFDISGSLHRETMTKIQLYQTIASLAELRDNETGNHMRRVGIFAKILAKEYGMPEKYCNDIEIFAPLHDIGKVGILDSLLLAERKLTPGEFEVMKTHTTLGNSIVKGMKELEMVAAITIAHHEWYNGKGYPYGIAEDSIPLSARIAAIADVYDALRSRRPYKGEWSHVDAREFIIGGAGSQFDPELVAVFQRMSGRFESVYSELKD